MKPEQAELHPVGHGHAATVHQDYTEVAGHSVMAGHALALAEGHPYCAWASWFHLHQVTSALLCAANTTQAKHNPYFQIDTAVLHSASVVPL